MKRIHGRKGQPTEYVQFTAKKGITVAAQRVASGSWSVFYVESGEKGAVRVVSVGHKTMSEAEAKAKEEAEAIKDGRAASYAWEVPL